MTPHFIVQASGAMFSKAEGDWTFAFGVFVTDEEGTPVESLTKKNFSVWELVWVVEEKKTEVLQELNAIFPQSHMPGIYRLQTVTRISKGGAYPQEFVCAIRVAQTREKALRQGMTTVPVTFLGPPLAVV
jgi:hypothetical protein